jgi:2-polyprenyl-6-methoxyphenol hydroxylase-like FAD-dependent oxidoreductase
MIATLIVGGGIGGLSLARELTLRGLPATVLEKAPRIDPVGAGIIMNPNAMAVLERNGLADAVRTDSWPYLARETCDQRGRRLAMRDYRPLYDAGKLARGALVHRAHLLDVLLRSVPGGAVHFGAAVAEVAAGPGGVRARTADGRVFEADVLVGADGIHSVVRSQLFGPLPARYMGYRSHRFVVDNPGIPCFTEFLGHGRRVGLVPISAQRLYVWTTFNSPRERPPLVGAAADLRSGFAEFTDARVKEAFARVRSTDEVILTEIEELQAERWVVERAALLGDAAHAMTPNIGQGAGMAMEDAAVLAEELKRAPEPQAALQNYARRREPRVDTIMKVSREIGADGQRAGRLACWLRNRRVERAGRDVDKSLADLERLLAYPL